MKRKYAFLILSCLIAVALVLSSCSSADDEDTDTTTPTTTEPTEPVVDPNEPIYGGTLTMIAGSNPLGFDPAQQLYNQQTPLHPALEQLATMDWDRGPSGTNEWSFEAAWAEPAADMKVGRLLRSWEQVTTTHYIYHLREGIMWQDRPGIHEAREVTADDIVSSLNRILANDINYWSSVEGTPDSFTAIDRYSFEVTFESPDPFFPENRFIYMYGHAAPDVIEEYGDMSDWKTVTGTGPFILKDYVADSALEWERNPNYWGKDKDGNSLPYIDELIVLVIPDPSTSLAALRTGQVDIRMLTKWQDAASLEETNPELERKGSLDPTAWDIELNQRTPPFGPTQDEDARKVRLAMSMAIDRDSIINDYYQGNAGLVASLVPEVYQVEGLKMENLPPDVAEFYDYNPERARELIIEAGYPDGIKTSIGVIPTEADFYALITSMWDEIGVEVEIEVIEVGVFWGSIFNQSWEGMMGAKSGSSFSFSSFLNNEDGTPYGWNLNASVCPECDEIARAGAAEFDWDKRIEDLEAITLAGAATGDLIWLPSPFLYTYWQPWVKGYHGEFHWGYGETYGIATRIWIDPSEK